MTRYFMTAAAALTTLGISSGVALAQAATTWDFGRDPATGEAAFDDFNASFDERGVYDMWDADQDEMLTRDEFNRGVFDMFDANRDEILDEDEMGGMAEERLFADETVKAGGAPTKTQD